MTDLSPEAKQLLDLARDEDSPAREDRDRVRRALAATLAAGAASGASMSAAAATKGTFGMAGVVGAASKGTVMWLMMGVAAGLVGSATVFVAVPAFHGTSKATDGKNVVAAHAVATPVRVLAIPEALAPSPLATTEPSQTTPLVAHGTPQKSKPLRPNASPVTPSAAMATRATAETPAAPDIAAPPVVVAAAPEQSLGVETSLLERARAALTRGDAAGALTLLDQHEHEFPRGALVEERLATRVFALCSIGRPADAARVASRLLALSPSSPFRARIAESCAGSR